MVEIKEEALDYGFAKYCAYEHELNVDPIDPNRPGRLVSPLRDFRVKGLPPTRVLMDVMAERLQRVEMMWELGDGDSHYKRFQLWNCEPFGIRVELISRHRNRYLESPRYCFVVLPSLACFLHPTETLESVLGKLLRASCAGTGCNLDATRIDP